MPESDEKSKDSRGATKWDFGIKAMEVFWNILDHGHFIRVLIILVLVLLFIIMSRMSPEDIAPSLRLFMGVFGSRIVLHALYIALITVIITIWRYQVKILKRECKRLGDDKSYWVHQPPIKNHTSSEYDWPESRNIAGPAEARQS